jgi:hypothetical protein
MIGARFRVGAGVKAVAHDATRFRHERIPLLLQCPNQYEFELQFCAND